MFFVEICSKCPPSFYTTLLDNPSTPFNPLPPTGARPLAPRTTRKQKVRWPFQTKSEDEGHGLDPCLAEIVTTARDWLVARCFVNVDGPWVGGAGVGWRQTTVLRTHAAMCADAVLRPCWGAGHCIMGFAEQARYCRPSFEIITTDFAGSVADSRCFGAYTIIPL